MWTSRKIIMKMSQNFIAQIVPVVSMVYENQVHTKKVKKFSSVLSAKVIGTIYFQHIRLSSLKVDMKPTVFFNRWNYHLWSSQNETNKHKFSNLSCPLGPSIKKVLFSLFLTPLPHVIICFTYQSLFDPSLKSDDVFYGWPPLFLPIRYSGVIGLQKTILKWHFSYTHDVRKKCSMIPYVATWIVGCSIESFSRVYYNCIFF